MYCVVNTLLSADRDDPGFGYWFSLMSSNGPGTSVRGGECQKYGVSAGWSEMLTLIWVSGKDRQ